MDRASHAPSPRSRPATTFLCMRHRPPLPFTVERPMPKQAAAPDVRTPTRQATRERRSPRRAGGDHTPHVRTARSLQRACRRPHGTVVRATNARRRRSVWAARCLSRFPWLIDDRRPSAWPQSIWLVIATTTRGRHDARSVLCSCIHDPAKYIP